MTDSEFDEFVDFAFGNAQFLGVEFAGSRLDWVSIRRNMMANAVFYFDRGERRSENLREGVQEFIVGVVDFIDKSNWIRLSAERECGRDYV